MTSGRRPARGEAGFTLLELIIAAIITGIIALVIGRTITDAATGLERAANDTLAAQSAMRLSRMLKYDIAGAQDVFIFGATAPTKLCSSNTSAITTNTPAGIWTIGASTTPFLRVLVNIKVKEVDTGYPSDSATPGWQTGRPVWIGYEVSRAAWNGTTNRVPQYQLWRVVCDDATGAPAATYASREKIADLGTSYPSNTAPTGAGATGTFQCFGITGAPTCPASTAAGSSGSTSSATGYRFVIPYTDKRLTLKKLADSTNLLTSLKRRIDA